MNEEGVLWEHSHIYSEVLQVDEMKFETAQVVHARARVGFQDWSCDPRKL